MKNKQHKENETTELTVVVNENTTKETKTTKKKTVFNWKNKVIELPTKSDDTPRNKEFEKLCRMEQLDVKNHCANRLKNMEYEPINNPGFLFAKGEYPVLLVAHLDTVHTAAPKKFIYNKGVVHSPTGIGGDDRCGLYIILNIVKEIKCSVVFLEDEEVGCIGAGVFSRSNEMKSIKDEIKYIVEFDRRGSNDAVFYDCDNKEFEDFITENGKGYFETDWGSCSDISTIAPAMGIAAVNLSSGYHSEHTSYETVNLEEMERTIIEAKKILLKPCEEKFKYVKKKWGYWYDDEYYCELERYYSELGYDYYDKRDREAYEYYETNSDIDEFASTTVCSDGTMLIFSNEKDVEQCFHIHYEDLARDYFVAEIWANSKVEAIGLFLIRFPHCTYSNIITIKDSIL